MKEGIGYLDIILVTWYRLKKYTNKIPSVHVQLQITWSHLKYDMQWFKMLFIVNINNLTCLECIFYVLNRIYKGINSYTYRLADQQKSRATLRMKNVVTLTQTEAWYMFCVHQSWWFYESRVTMDLHKTSNLTVVVLEWSLVIL